MKLTTLLNEGMVTAYHGRTVKSKEFSLDFIGGKGANDQQGPGFYFSSDESESYGYSKGKGTVFQVQIKTDKMVNETKRTNSIPAKKLIRLAPNLDDILIDWGYDEGFSQKSTALKELQNSIIVPSMKETLLNIWGDCYLRSGHSKQFVQNCINLGIDGLITKYGSKIHYIVYNKDIIKIVKEIS